ncbi:MAG: 6,7-dimethyl-8-ribityllumazine synthase, partial [Deltaproteobacteria bacterium]|nr:6,7-dimethyl-8-ribityllumazine synthase [Deltaproteobacteria bacterium]
MTNIKEGVLSARGFKFALIASRFNHFITDKIVEGAVDALLRHEAEEKNITLIKVPGAFEIPQVARLASESGKYDAIICLATIIRGGTPHFEYIASEAAKGIAAVSLQSKMPVVFGVLTTENIEQAIERAGTNK